jgi:hypothetical protein
MHCAGQGILVTHCRKSWSASNFSLPCNFPCLLQDAILQGQVATLACIPRHGDPQIIHGATGALRKQFEPSSFRKLLPLVGAEQHPMAQGGNKLLSWQQHCDDSLGGGQCLQQHQALPHVVGVADS